MNKEKIARWNEELREATAQDTIRYFLDEFGDTITFSTSMGAEDQVITDMVVQIDPSVRIFTLDTGRLFQETYDLIDQTNEKYGIQIEVIFPDYQQVEKMVKEKGMNLFYHSVENRKLCCGIRKVEPLKRAFKGMDGWICGLRKDQSVSRFFSQKVEWDEQNQLVKINPLIDWTEKDTWNYIHENQVPYNSLHDKGYASIGCLPCTRPIKPGEDFRAGRWWWEDEEQKECGLHKR